MTGIKIPVEAQLDQGDTQRVLAEFAAQLNKMGAAVAKANKVKFNPVDKASLDDVKRITSAYENLRRVSSEHARRLKATNQTGASFTNVNYGAMYPDESVRARQMRKHFEYVVGDRFTGAGVDGGGGGGGGGSRQPPAPSQPGGGGSLPGRGIIGAGLNAAGPVGGVANSALSAGLSGGVGAGLAGLAGGLAALAVGKAVSAVAEKVNSAQQLSIGYDTLKRTLGDVNVSFNVLRESIKASSAGLDMTFEEGQSLGLQFAKLSGMTADNYKSLADEVSVGGGLSRSYGMDPSQGNAFMGNMRMFGVTSNTQQSRELALMIGESIAKAKVFTKADDVLEAIAGFTAQQTRTGMGVANVSDYAGMLTGMMSSKIPGMDPQSAAALLGRINSSISGGGSAGEAGQNFMYSAIGSKLGLNPFQAMLMREQGAFGTGAGLFGGDGLYSKFAGQNGMQSPGGAAGSQATNLELIMSKLKQVYAGKPELMVNAMSNLFGVNNSQAMALSMVKPATLGALGSRLKKNGVNINDVNAGGISKIAQIESDDKLSDAEKDQRIKSAATENQEKTEGSQTRATINGVERAVTDMAGKMVPLMNDMRSGIMFMAGGSGKLSPRQIMESIAQTESNDRADTIKGKWGASKNAAGESLARARSARSAYERSMHDGYGKLYADADVSAYQSKITELVEAEKAAKLQKDKADLGEEYTRALDDEKRQLERTIDGIRNPSSSAAGGASYIPGGTASWGREDRGAASSNASYDELFEKYGKQFGVDPKLLKTIGIKESGLNANAIGAMNDNGTQDFGLMQHNSRYMAGRGITDWKSPEQQIAAAAKLMRENIDSAGGDVRGGVRRYNGSGPRAEAYADSVMAMYPSTPMPSGATGSADGTPRAAVDVTVRLEDRDGKRAAPPVTVTGVVPLPNPKARN